MLRLRHSVCFVLIAILSACGGGGGAVNHGSKPPAPAPAPVDNDRDYSQPLNAQWEAVANALRSLAWVPRRSGTVRSLSSYSQDQRQAATSGDGSYIALVDTGFDDARFLDPNNKPNIDRISRLAINSKDGHRFTLEQGFKDPNGHGTAMAAVMLSTAPKVAINVFGRREDASFSEIGMQSLLSSLDYGAKVHIMNASYGLPGEIPDYLQAMLEGIVQHDILVLQSTGNTANHLSGGQPEGYPLLPHRSDILRTGAYLNVTAYNPFLHRKEHVPCGQAKDWCITAPSPHRIPTVRTASVSQPGATVDRNSVGGTSAAAAYASAVAAQVKSRFDWFSSLDLKNTLITTAIDKGTKGVDSTWGHGLLNPEAALGGYGRFDDDVILRVEGRRPVYFFDNAIAGNGGFYKEGSGTLVLMKHNTFKGDTRVREGMLVLNHRNPNTRVTVSQGATLATGDTLVPARVHSLTLQEGALLDMRLSKLDVSHDVHSRGVILTAVGDPMLVGGTADLRNSYVRIDGIRPTVVTRAGREYVLLEATQLLDEGLVIGDKAIGHLLKAQVKRTPSRLSVYLRRDSLSEHQADFQSFEGLGDTVAQLDGLLDSIDKRALCQVPRRCDGDAASLAGNRVHHRLMNSLHLAQDLFELNHASYLRAHHAFLNQLPSNAPDWLEGRSALVWAGQVQRSALKGFSGLQVDAGQWSQTLQGHYRWASGWALSAHLRQGVQHWHEQWSAPVGADQPQPTKSQAQSYRGGGLALQKQWGWGGLSLYGQALHVRSTAHWPLWQLGVRLHGVLPVSSSQWQVDGFVGANHQIAQGAQYTVAPLVELTQLRTQQSWVEIGLRARWQFAPGWAVQQQVQLRHLLKHDHRYTLVYDGHTVNNQQASLPLDRWQWHSHTQLAWQGERWGLAAGATWQYGRYTQHLGAQVQASWRW